MKSIEFYNKQIEITKGLLQKAHEELADQLEIKEDEYAIQELYTMISTFNLYLQNCEFNKKLILENIN